MQIFSLVIMAYFFFLGDFWFEPQGQFFHLKKGLVGAISVHNFHKCVANGVHHFSCVMLTVCPTYVCMVLTVCTIQT